MPREPRRPRRVREIPRRIARFVRAVFGGDSPRRGWDEIGEEGGGIGVREPRRPLTPTLTGAAALDLPANDENR